MFTKNIAAPNKTKIFVSLVGLLLVLLMLMTGITPASATTTVSISPSTQIVSQEQSFTINISIEPDTAIAGAQFNLQFNSSIVNVNSVMEGELFKQNGANTFFNSGTIDNVAGVVTHVWGNILNTSGAPKNVSTSGTFAIINITASSTAAGTSPLALIGVPPISVLVSDPEGNAVPISVINGTMKVNRAPELDSIGDKSIDDVAIAEETVKGTRKGNYTHTHASDDVYESITEVESKGNPAERYSYLEHKWTIDVTGDSDFVFHVEAYQIDTGENDPFMFAYSTDDSTYTPIVTVTKTTDDNTYQTYTFTESITGTVYIRVKDTDRTAGNKVLDTISIDHMFIRSKSSSPSYGVTVTVDEASQQVKLGESTTYTVRVKNTGDFEASYSVVMSGTAVDEATITVSPLSWNTGTLAPNAEDMQTVTVSTTSSTPETTYTLTATATCEQDASVKDSATSELGVSSATNAMHVASTDMSLKTAGPNTNARALVTIVDATGTPVDGATVSGHWSGATTDTDSGKTDASGPVSLLSLIHISEPTRPY